MSNFGNYAFEESNNRTNNTNGYYDVTEIMAEIADKMEATLAPYKEVMKKEFNSLKKNNEAWRNNHEGEECKPFNEKMWALSAPFESISIIRRLYVNRERKEN